MRCHIKLLRLLIIMVFVLAVPSIPLSAGSSLWNSVDEGLDIGIFDSPRKSVVGDSKIIVIRIDTNQYSLKLLSVSEYLHPHLTVKQWCEKYQLIGAINAGMYQKNFISNVGYMKNFLHINNGHVNKKFLSVMGFNPIDIKKSKPFRIMDIDEHAMSDIVGQYQTVVQNLRLVKRSRKNKWSEQGKSWSEAALGQDSDGNALFIFSRSPYTMHEFNNIMLSLPIKLECAQHLEGGPEASLFFFHNNKKLELVGSYESGLYESDKNVFFLPLPNVLGIIKNQ